MAPRPSRVPTKGAGARQPHLVPLLVGGPLDKPLHAGLRGPGHALQEGAVVLRPIKHLLLDALEIIHWEQRQAQAHREGRARLTPARVSAPLSHRVASSPSLAAHSPSPSSTHLPLGHALVCEMGR